ncbi:hypothetical protein [Yinghuangia seranimata]|uniref:hypothetical protein n=1 Tax=Yinghuangia seranimata TaxID=408067 RepID=UPI00248BE2CF|nr:hypothetical protein [Yinghuangia seranimata]MDI2128181.1 hypothetical protein [Yinghuangia seranimata]
MDTTPRGVGDEDPTPQGRGGTATGTEPAEGKRSEGRERLTRAERLRRGFTGADGAVSEGLDGTPSGASGGASSGTPSGTSGAGSGSASGGANGTSNGVSNGAANGVSNGAAKPASNGASNSSSTAPRTEPRTASTTSSAASSSASGPAQRPASGAVPPSAPAAPNAPGALTQLAVGAHLLTLGGPDGSEVVPLPANARPLPRRRSVAPRTIGYPPLGRQLELAEIRGLLTRGTSVRVGGPAGIGRSTLLRHVASGDAAGAPDGVVVLDGYRRGLDDLLQQFHDACFGGEPHRPTRDALRDMLSEVAALVVVDDLDLSADELAELLRIAPECVFLAASPSTPGDGPEPSAAARADSPFYEITLGGLPQEAAFALLARATGRELDDEELAWAAALWFEVDGHPGRFAQAGALLARLGTAVSRAGRDYIDGPLPELPSPGEPQLFVPRLLPLLSRPAQQVLRLGAALEGVLPDPAHLPALTGAVDANGAASELVAAGLVVVQGGRYRLAGGVADEAAGLMRGPSSWAVAAMQHFTWWVSHPSVTAHEVADEADVILACLREVERLGKPSSVRVLARAAAPAFAAALRFEAWRDALELGGAAAAASGAGTEQAWFVHESAVLALCTGDLPRAREEAVAASRLRDAADKRGIAADRRILVMAGERPGAFGGEPGVVRAPRRVTVSGKRGAITLAAAAVLVVTLAVVVAMGSGAPGSGGGGPSPSDGVSVTTLNGAPNGAIPGAATSAPAPTGPPTANHTGPTPTPTGSIRSSAGTKSPTATGASTRPATAPAPPPGEIPPPPPAGGGDPPPVSTPPTSPAPPTSHPPSSSPPSSSSASPPTP